MRIDRLKKDCHATERGIVFFIKYLIKLLEKESLLYCIGDNVPRPKINIPLEDIKGLKTLINEGKTQEEIAEYYTKCEIVRNTE